MDQDMKKYWASLILREMKMEITMWYRCRHTEMSKIEKTEDTRYWLECGRTKSHEISCGNEQMRRPRVCKANFHPCIPTPALERSHTNASFQQMASPPGRQWCPINASSLGVTTAAQQQEEQLLWPGTHCRSHHHFTVLVPEPWSQHPFSF